MTTFRFLLVPLMAATLSVTTAKAQGDLDDLEMAHVAVTASEIDIAYAHLALALSENDGVREFAETMIRDHTAVNAQVAALARELNVQAKDNPMSRQLLREAAAIKDQLSQLRGAEFDQAYALNELRYHRTVNGVVEDAFLPNLENPRVREAFAGALTIFRGHEHHAAMLVERVALVR